MNYELISCSEDIARVEIINPRRDIWAMRWGVTTDATTGEITCFEARQTGRPTEADIRAARAEQINDSTSRRILQGMTWEGKPVWLSAEQQANISAIASAGDAVGYPLTLKLGETSDGAPVYETFASAAAFAPFATAVTRHLLSCLTKGYRAKDGDSEAPLLPKGGGGS